MGPMHCFARLLTAWALVAAADPALGAQGASTSPSAGDGAPERFDVWEYRVVGNTVLERAQIERAVYPFLGPGKTIEDVNGARDALRTLYADAGYATARVFVPEQEVLQGVVRLEVAGSVDRVQVRGGRWFDRDDVREAVPAFEPGDLPNVDDAQDQLLALNARSSDRRVRPVLRTGRAPGTLEVLLEIEDEAPLHGSLAFNNRATKQTTESRVDATLSYDNLWQRQHALSLQYQFTPEDPDEVQVLVGTYLWRFAGSRDLLVLYGVENASNIAALGDTTVLGSGNIFGARYVRPFPRRGNWLGSLSFGADYKAFDDVISLGEGVELATPIDYVHFDADLSVTRLGESLFGGQRRTRLGLGASWGVRGLGNERREFEEKRFRGQPNYAYANLELHHEEGLPRGFELILDARGRFTDQPLISNEQFVAGGLNSVRGYREAERLGDFGVVTQLQLTTPELAGWVPDRNLVPEAGFLPRWLWDPAWFEGLGVASLRLHGFVDYGSLGLHEPIDRDADRHYSLLSTGLGLVAEGGRGWDAALDWSVPLKDADQTRRGDQRLLFNLRVGF